MCRHLRLVNREGDVREIRRQEQAGDVLCDCWTGEPPQMGRGCQLGIEGVDPVVIAGNIYGPGGTDSQAPYLSNCTGP